MSEKIYNGKEEIAIMLDAGFSNVREIVDRNSEISACLKNKFFHAVDVARLKMPTPDRETMLELGGPESFAAARSIETLGDILDSYEEMESIRTNYSMQFFDIPGGVWEEASRKIQRRTGK